MFKRKSINPRLDWQNKVEEDGMDYHTIDGKVYWNESNYYHLDSKLVDKIEEATEELHDMCIAYVGDTVKSGDYDIAYQFDPDTIRMIEQSWINGHKSVYGRFDLGIDNKENLKMFEYNADTPTSLLEASAIQWNWKEHVWKDKDQFNSIHEKLVDHWRNNIKQDSFTVYFTTMANAPKEDWGNLHYLLETASQAGLSCTSIDLEAIGWDSENLIFADMNNYHIETIFKLYPWEWMRSDEFYKNIPKSLTRFIEPPWKMLLSNKLLNVKLWERNKGHPLLLESHKVGHNWGWFKKAIRKPMLGREGQGVEKISFFSRPVQGTIEQAKFKSVSFKGIQPVIGSWIIGDNAAGIGIREDKGITTNNSCFVPHIFD